MGTSDNPQCPECGGKMHKSSNVMTRSRGLCKKWHCTSCGAYVTEGANKPKYMYDFSEHPYTIVVVE